MCCLLSYICVKRDGKCRLVHQKLTTNKPRRLVVTMKCLFMSLRAVVMSIIVFTIASRRNNNILDVCTVLYCITPGTVLYREEEAEVFSSCLPISEKLLTVIMTRSMTVLPVHRVLLCSTGHTPSRNSLAPVKWM